MPYPTKIKQSNPLFQDECVGQLFFGLPITEDVNIQLAQSHPPTMALFISEGTGLYLEQRSHQGVSYLGKSLRAPASYEMLKSIEQHVYSLLCRILKEELVKRENFVLFAL